MAKGRGHVWQRVGMYGEEGHAWQRERATAADSMHLTGMHLFSIVLVKRRQNGSVTHFE